MFQRECHRCSILFSLAKLNLCLVCRESVCADCFLQNHCDKTGQVDSRRLHHEFVQWDEGLQRRANAIAQRQCESQRQTYGALLKANKLEINRALNELKATLNERFDLSIAQSGGHSLIDGGFCSFIDSQADSAFVSNASDLYERAAVSSETLTLQLEKWGLTAPSAGQTPEDEILARIKQLIGEVTELAKLSCLQDTASQPIRSKPIKCETFGEAPMVSIIGGGGISGSTAESQTPTKSGFESPRMASSFSLAIASGAFSLAKRAFGEEQICGTATAGGLGCPSNSPGPGRSGASTPGSPRWRSSLRCLPASPAKKKKRQTTPARRAEPGGPDKEKKTFCLCDKGEKEGGMVLCNNLKCATPSRWFHYGCVGVQKRPTGRWFCPPCRVAFPTEFKKRKRRIKRYYDFN